MAEGGVALKSGKKNIVICCDGTGNRFLGDPRSKGSNSNVVKLYTALKIDNEQVGYYHPGVGTAGDPAAKRWVGKQWSKLKGLAFGAGFQANVFDAYRYLMQTFDDGDQVFLIGFSRGAYTVRALAGLLAGYGLLCRGNEGHLPYAWNEYVRQHKDRERETVHPDYAFRETFSRKGFRIYFLGIWDTVSSVGWIKTPLQLWDVAHPSGIDVARHAISIDERRCYYRDNLFVDGVSVKEKKRQVVDSCDKDRNGKPDWLQVWFPGVHSDVGGSYPQRESGLSNAALQWLVMEAKAADAHLKDNMVELVLGEPSAPEGDEGTAEHTTDRIKICRLEALYRKPERTVIHRSLCGPWWLLEIFPHAYYDLDEGEEQMRTPLGMRRRIPKDAYVHLSALDRIEEHENLIGGKSSLFPVRIPGQKDGTILQYRPADNPRPRRNRWRWAVMVGVSLVELLIVAPVAVWPLVHWLRRYWRWAHVPAVKLSGWEVTWGMSWRLLVGVVGELVAIGMFAAIWWWVSCKEKER